MKSRLIKDEQMKQLESVFEHQLSKTQAIGMSYGSKIFAQVIKDKFDDFEDVAIENMTEEQMRLLLIGIKDFTDKTLESNIKDVIQIFEDNQKGIKKFLELTKEEQMNTSDNSVTEESNTSIYSEVEAIENENNK